MKKIAIFTTSRAEFGILSALINEISSSTDLSYKLFVGGAHLADEYGNSIQEIYTGGFEITDTFDYLLNGDKPVALAGSAGIATIELAYLFKKYNFDFVCVLGDRFELLSIVQNAIIFRKPIIHIHGGEKSEGAIDEQIRHMITKAAHIHFVACDEYAQNIRRMGEPEWRIFNCGALAIDNIRSLTLLSRAKLFTKLKLDENKPTVLLTFHPTTLEFNLSPAVQIQNIFDALKNFNLQVVITAPNVESGRDSIIEIIKAEIQNKPDYHYVESLGVKKYLNLIPCCKFVIGNSSSGIIEVPYFRIPTINIGNRQKGRIQHQSIINADYSVSSITDAIKRALSDDFTKSFQNMKYKFGDGTAAAKMVEVLKKTTIDQKLLTKELNFPD
jgi:GDP/UDP-N,N'-diacetylbacillosamine 2-epimerase (hydrolysing)